MLQNENASRLGPTVEGPRCEAVWAAPLRAVCCIFPAVSWKDARLAPLLVPNSTKLTRIVIRDGPGTKIFATLYFLCCKVHKVRQVTSDRAHVVHGFFVIRTCAKTRRSRGNVGRAAMFMRLRFRFSNLLC